MKMISIVILLSIFSYQVVDAKHWALIVAGSNGWYNYRHQADACHAYQIMHNNGIPDENIVVMMYDDIAHNYNNPTPGKIINKPGGDDVYKGVLKDYTGSDVTPENFLNILKGNASAMVGIGSGKVIDSGPGDYVFVNFADHGAPNLIAFPSGELYARDLKHAINYMHREQRYKEMVFYIEACESGSMFNRHKLNPNISVFATTAANGAESSYACYYDEDRETYLGDVYSVNWMENSDKANPMEESLQEQFEMVKEETNTSHVQEFGDLNLSRLPIGVFQGEDSLFARKKNRKIAPRVPITDAVPSPDVPLMIMYNQFKKAKTEEKRESVLLRIKAEEESRMLIETTMRKIAERLVPHPLALKNVMERIATAEEEICYQHVVGKFRKHCFDFNKHEHALRHIYVLANLCDSGVPTESIHGVIEDVCAVADE